MSYVDHSDLSERLDYGATDDGRGCVDEAVRVLLEVNSALGYATRLAQEIHAKHYSHVAQWKPMPDLIGVLTQIDNMTSELVPSSI